MFSFEINVLCDDPDHAGGCITSDVLPWPDTEEALCEAVIAGWQLIIEAGKLYIYCPKCAERHNDTSSATRRTGRNNCKPRRPAGFAAAHG
jgi:hypothetical protein